MRPLSVDTVVNSEVVLLQLSNFDSAVVCMLCKGWFTRYPAKRPKTKTSQVICQNVTFLVSQNVPSIFSLYLSKLEIANFFVNTLVKCPKSNRPKSKVSKSKRPKSKRPRVKCPRVKTFQSQNVPSQNVPESKCPRVKTSQVKNVQVKTSQVKTSSLVCLPANNITHTVMKFLAHISNMLYYSDNLLSTSL